MTKNNFPTYPTKEKQETLLRTKKKKKSLTVSNKSYKIIYNLRPRRRQMETILMFLVDLAS